MRVHEDWLLTAQRVAIHVPTRTAVLADLHLGYDAARQRRGEAPILDFEQFDFRLTPISARRLVRPARAHRIRRARPYGGSHRSPRSKNRRPQT